MATCGFPIVLKSNPTGLAIEDNPVIQWHVEVAHCCALWRNLLILDLKDDCSYTLPIEVNLSVVCVKEHPQHYWDKMLYREKNLEKAPKQAFDFCNILCSDLIFTSQLMFSLAPLYYFIVKVMSELSLMTYLDIQMDSKIDILKEKCI